MLLLGCRGKEDRSLDVHADATWRKLPRKIRIMLVVALASASAWLASAPLVQNHHSPLMHTSPLDVRMSETTDDAKALLMLFASRQSPAEEKEEAMRSRR